MIEYLQKTFGSKTKAQETIFLLHDVKEVVRQGFYPAELPAVEEFCKKEKIFLVKSAFKVLLEEETLGGAFTNKGVRVPSDHPQGMFFMYLSKDEKKAYLAAYYEQIGDDKELGLLLGYPQCCVDFFCRMFSGKNTDPQIASQNPATNIGLRGQDIVLLSHFPCREDCRKSIPLGQKYFKVLLAYWPERAEELASRLGDIVEEQKPPRS